MLTMTTNYNNAINASKRIIKAKAELFDVSALVATYTQNDAIKSINIERVGEDSKFFGVGITHKMNIKLIDINREIDLTTDNYFKIQLGIELNNGSIEYVSFPKMYITEVNRDENTNELSITAYDVLNEAKTLTMNDLELTKPYSIRNVVEAVGAKIGANNIKIGKNLLNLKDGTYSQNGITAIVENGTITLNGTATETAFVSVLVSNNYQINDGEKFTVSANNPIVNLNIRIRINNNGVYDTALNSVNRIATYTKESKYPLISKHLTIRIQSGETLENYVIKPQLEVEGPTNYEPYLSVFDTEYTDGANFEGTEILKDVLTAVAEATQTIYFIDSNDNLVFKRLDRDGEAVKTISKANYITLDSSTNRRLATICHATELGDNVSASKMEKSNKTINVDLGDNELCSIGDVKDELVIENSSAKIIKRIGKVVLNGTENFYLRSNNNNGTTTFMISNFVNYKFIENTGCKCSHFEYLGSVINGDETKTKDVSLSLYYQSTNPTERVVYINSNIDNLADFKTWLSTHNTTVYYELATPEEIDFDISGLNLADGVYYGESIQEATPSPDNPSEIVNKKAVDANILYPITGTTQYIRDNPFWELREDIADLLEDAKNAICGITVNQFNCDWRGDLALEIGDKIALVTKDNNTVTTYLLNDVITYNGGLSQSSEWQYTDDEESESNPNNLGDAIKQTFAKVDKANKQINLLVSEVAANNSSISSLQMSTDAINANVQKDINELTNKVNATMTAEDVKIEIQNELSNGVDKVTTKTGFTFDDEGLTVSKDGSEMTTTIDEDGMTVYRDSEEMLKANNEGVIAYNLHAKTYLIVGESSRFEDYEKDGETRTGCFWIGDTEV